MTIASSINNREELQRKIALLQWDIQHITDDEVKARKMKQLEQLRNELNQK